MDVVFLVDTSGSIRQRNFRKIRDFLSELITELDVDSGKINVGMVTFADDVQLIFELDEFDTR